MGSFFRFLLTLFLLYVAFQVIFAVLSLLFKLALILLILSIAFYVYNKAARNRFRRYFR